MNRYTIAILAGMAMALPAPARANDQIWFETDSTQFGCMTIAPDRIMGMDIAGGVPGMICERRRPDPVYVRIGLHTAPEVLPTGDFIGFSGDSTVLPNDTPIRWRDITCMATATELMCRADDGRGFLLDATHAITWGASQSGKTP